MTSTSVKRYAVFAGPLLVVTSRAVPEQRRGLRFGLMLAGGVLTVAGLWNEYRRSAWAS